jgi:hypothetical protein
MDLHLAGRTALITGASKGIGLAVAQCFASEGVNLVLSARSKELLEQNAAELRAKYKVKVDTVPADLSDQAARDRLVTAYPNVDILINNAGAIPGGTIFEVDDKAWRAGWDLKVFGYVNLSRAFYQAMKPRRDGVILNVIGYAGERHNAKYVIGSTGNAALMAFTRTAGSQSPDFGVRILGVNPGYTATDRAEDQLRTFAQKKFGDAERWRDIEKEFNLPFGRMAKPQEIADTVAFLVSPRAGYISGTIVTVDGGATHRNF